MRVDNVNKISVNNKKVTPPITPVKMAIVLFMPQMVQESVGFDVSYRARDHCLAPSLSAGCGESLWKKFGEIVVIPAGHIHSGQRPEMNGAQGRTNRQDSRFGAQSDLSEAKARPMDGPSQSNHRRKQGPSKRSRRFNDLRGG